MAAKQGFAANRIQQVAWAYYVVMGVLCDRNGIVGQVVRSARGAHHLTLSLRLADPLRRREAIEMADALALAARVENVIAGVSKEKPGLINYQFQLPEEMWETYTRADVRGLGVGLAEQRALVQFGWDYPHRPHTLVTGTTGAGKSETIKTIMAAMASQYTPDKLQMAIIDPHRDHEVMEGVDHVVVVARTEENIHLALMWVQREFLQRRENSIKDAHRIVTVIDEAGDVIKDPHNLATAQQIGAEGRKFGMHLVLGIQNPKQKTLPDILDKCQERYIGAVDSAQTSARLSLTPGLQLHRLSMNGDFMQMCGGSTAMRFQVAMATTADCERLPRGAGASGDDLARLGVTRGIATAMAGQADTYDEEADKRTAQTQRLGGLLSVLRGGAPTATGGRPPAMMKDRTLAFYLWRGADNVTARIAREVLNLGRDVHERYKARANEIEDEIRLLEAGNPPTRELEAAL